MRDSNLKHVHSKTGGPHSCYTNEGSLHVSHRVDSEPPVYNVLLVGNT
jgi:hypothetical protein